MAYANNKDMRGRTDLHHAIINNKPEQVANLLEQGADPNIRDQVGRNGFTPLYYAACEKRNPTTVTMLKTAKANIDAQTMSEIQRQAKMQPLNKQLREIRTILGIK